MADAKSKKVTVKGEVSEEVVKVNPFLESALENVNKTEADVLTEKVTLFLEEAAIETEMQIAERTTGAIPRKELELRTATRNLDKAEVALEKAKVAVPSNSKLETYLSNLYSAENAVRHAKVTVEAIEGQITDLNKEVVKLEEILARFKA